MIEITAIILLITFILIGRLTKPRQLEGPVVIARSGNYHVTLAPRLNLAITFIERIAHSYRARTASPGDSATLYLAVNDPSLKRYAIESYLLAIILRNGMLYFQAMQPVLDGGNSYRQLDDFAQAALKNMPPAEVPPVQQDERLFAAAEQATAGLDISIQALPEGSAGLPLEIIRAGTIYSATLL
jgi:hypothetical protein